MWLAHPLGSLLFCTLILRTWATRELGFLFRIGSKADALSNRGRYRRFISILFELFVRATWYRRTRKGARRGARNGLAVLTLSTLLALCVCAALDCATLALSHLLAGGTAGMLYVLATPECFAALTSVIVLV